LIYQGKSFAYGTHGFPDFDERYLTNLTMVNSFDRILSASAAAWVRLLLTALAQALLVPVYLGHWSVEQYGCWLIIQTIVSIASILSLSYQNFIGFEFLRIGNNQPDKLRLLFYSALPLVVLIALLELSVLACLMYNGLINVVFDSKHSLDPRLLHETLWSLIIYSLSWLFSSSVGGLAYRALAPYGHFPRMSWWNTLFAVVAALTSGLAVLFGADLMWTVIWTTTAGLVTNIPFYRDIWRLFRHHGLYPIRMDWKLGLRSVAHSLAIASTAVLDISRLQGVRIFLGALLGIREMAAFATMVTISNLSMQGIGAITNPVMPEIMKFLREKDSERTNATIGFVWLLAVVSLTPVLVVLQCIMPAIFHAWTRGKIAFNPVLFGLFSITLLLSSVARPSTTVLQGNNLLRVQLFIAVAKCAIAVPGILVLTRALGAIGAGASMLMAELLGTVWAMWYASTWLRERGIGFPSRLFTLALASIALATFAIALMVWLPRHSAAIVTVSLFASCALFIALAHQLPPVAAVQFRGSLGRSYSRVASVLALKI
jgi:O-antigen/teichoic acid export membrane protein